jgi:hypothetical protein
MIGQLAKLRDLTLGTPRTVIGIDVAAIGRIGGICGIVAGDELVLSGRIVLVMGRTVGL